MIHSFEEKNLEKLFKSGKSQSGLPTDITNSLKRALEELHNAASEADLIRLKSRNYEKFTIHVYENVKGREICHLSVSLQNIVCCSRADGGANRVKLTAHAHA